MAENAMPSKRRTQEGSSEVITLAQPRPGTARRTNEYIETPLKPKVTSSSSSANGLPIRSQPKKLPEKLPDAGTTPDQRESASTGGDPQESIICRQCGRCRCDSCRTPRLMPSRWVCHDKFLCSASAAVDYCSCLCCVKGLFYHLGQNCDEADDESVSCSDQPCSCGPNQRCLRWGCLGVLSLALPCLCCYWPLRGCLRLAEKAYAQVTNHGCRCANDKTLNRTKTRLLDPDC